MPQWPKKKFLAQRAKLKSARNQNKKRKWNGERERQRKRTGARCAALSDVGSAVLHAYDVMTIITSQRAQRVEARERQRGRKNVGYALVRRVGV